MSINDAVLWFVVPAFVAKIGTTMHVRLSKKRVLVLAGAFVLVCLLVFGLQQAVLCAHESQSENEVIIHMDQKGYRPDKLSIRPGTKVTFENVGNQDHWPASDNHPSHTLYDGTTLEEHCGSDHHASFDACGPIASGQSYSFVFEKEGTYRFHDHLWPHLGGDIVVGTVVNSSCQEKRSILSAITSFFSRNKEAEPNSGNTNNDFYRDLEKKFEHIVLDADPRQAIQTLEQDAARDDKVSAFCHDLLHVIGHAAYKKYGSFEEAVKYQSDFCNSGYIHGLFESYFAVADDPLDGLADQCTNYASGKRMFDLWQCHHGIGHGFMYLTGGDLDESLALCERGLGKDALSCQNGVYMEVFNQEVLAKEKDFVNQDDPFLTCSKRHIATADCYTYVATYLSQTSGMDFRDILKACDKAGANYRKNCIYGVGAEVIKRNMNNPGNAFALCRQATLADDQTMCVSAVVEMYMNQAGSSAAGEKLCTETPSDYRVICRRSVADKEAFFRQP